MGCTERWLPHHSKPIYAKRWTRRPVLAQVLCAVASGWVGVAAKLGRAHVVFRLAAMLTFYVPLAAFVIYPQPPDAA